jgi:hypothetical protein
MSVRATTFSSFPRSIQFNAASSYLILSTHHFHQQTHDLMKTLNERVAATIVDSIGSSRSSPRLSILEFKTHAQWVNHAAEKAYQTRDFSVGMNTVGKERAQHVGIGGFTGSLSTSEKKRSIPDKTAVLLCDSNPFSAFDSLDQSYASIVRHFS